MNFFSLKNRIAVVTGGVGVLGFEYTKTLLLHGVKVAIFDTQDPVSNHELVDYVASGQLTFYSVDIASKPSVVKASGEVKKKYGAPDILINNAAIDFPPQKESNKFEDYPIEEFEKVVRVNLSGMIICCQVIGGMMAKEKKGSIINISSIYGMVSPDQRIYDRFIKPVSYSVTKSGVFNLTRYLATYWAKDSVRVNTLTLGGVFNGQDKNFVDRYKSKVPLGRMAHKSDYNGAIVFLSSDASLYMTGSNMIIDGGWTAW